MNFCSNDQRLENCFFEQKFHMMSHNLSNRLLFIVFFCIFCLLKLINKKINKINLKNKKKLSFFWLNFLFERENVQQQKKKQPENIKFSN